MTNHRKMDSEEEALFRSYPYALYFVQSPSTTTVSHSNSAELVSSRNIINNNNNNNVEYSVDSAFHSPLRSVQEVNRFASLSRYSSSHGSNNSFSHDKKMVFDLQSHETRPALGKDGLGIDDEEDEDEDEDEDEGEYYGGNRSSGGEWWGRHLSFRGPNASCGWIALQIIWRLLVSLGAALLVFYIVTKPPPPKMSMKIVGVRQFELGEGVDHTGVATKILTCNCSMNLVIENKSKLFGLHIHPPVMAMSFGNLPFAMSRGPDLYASSDGTTFFKLDVGTRNKPMYGAGRSMQDMLESGKGLPLVIRVSLRSSFHVVWNLIRPKFHHQVECLLVLRNRYDKKHRTQAYNSSCTIIF